MKKEESKKIDKPSTRAFLNQLKERPIHDKKNGTHFQSKEYTVLVKSVNHFERNSVPFSLDTHSEKTHLSECSQKRDSSDIMLDTMNTKKE